jgi:hypothetical protein
LAVNTKPKFLTALNLLQFPGEPGKGKWHLPFDTNIFCRGKWHLPFGIIEVIRLKILRTYAKDKSSFLVKARFPKDS